VSVADARSWSRSWLPIAECAAVGPTGIVRVRWCVPSTLSASDSYVVKFQSHPAAARSCEAEVGHVKVCPPLHISRVGNDEVQVHWSAGALPTDASAREGWRLAVDVAPIATPGECAGDVVEELFLHAASHGITAHTHRRSVLYDVSPAEASRRCKRLRLTTDRIYRVALAGRDLTSQASYPTIHTLHLMPKTLQPKSSTPSEACSVINGCAGARGPCWSGLPWAS
jgi:hypothetical protein